LIDIHSKIMTANFKDFNRFNDFSRNFIFFLEQFSQTTTTFAITQYLYLFDKI